MEVHLESDIVGDVLLGTVEEITGVVKFPEQGIGVSFGAIISDIVANMLYESEFPGDRGTREETLTVSLR